MKVLEDDLPGWARHAILRARSKGSGAAHGRPTLPVRPSAPSPAPLLQPPPDLDEGAIVRALLDLAETAKAETNTDGEPFFTPNPAANRFLIENPFATGAMGSVAIQKQFRSETRSCGPPRETTVTS